MRGRHENPSRKERREAHAASLIAPRGAHGTQEGSVWIGPVRSCCTFWSRSYSAGDERSPIVNTHAPHEDVVNIADYWAWEPGSNQQDRLW